MSDPDPDTIVGVLGLPASVAAFMRPPDDHACDGHRGKPLRCPPGPPVLLMDEPFGALDALTRVQVRHDLEQLWMLERPTVLFITHSVEEAVGLSDRVLVMSPSPGQVVEELGIDLPRPRPVALGEEPALSAFSKRICDHFARLGVINR